VDGTITATGDIDNPGLTNLEARVSVNEVAIASNTQEITDQGDEIDVLDTRVTDLENGDGGQALEIKVLQNKTLGLIETNSAVDRLAVNRNVTMYKAEGDVVGYLGTYNNNNNLELVTTRTNADMRLVSVNNLNVESSNNMDLKGGNVTDLRAPTVRINGQSPDSMIRLQTGGTNRIQLVGNETTITTNVTQNSGTFTFNGGDVQVSRTQESNAGGAGAFGVAGGIFIGKKCYAAEFKTQPGDIHIPDENEVAGSITAVTDPLDTRIAALEAAPPPTSSTVMFSGTVHLGAVGEYAIFTDSDIRLFLSTTVANEYEIKFEPLSQRAQDSRWTWKLWQNSVFVFSGNTSVDATVKSLYTVTGVSAAGDSFRFEIFPWRQVGTSLTAGEWMPPGDQCPYYDLGFFQMGDFINKVFAVQLKITSSTLPSEATTFVLDEPVFTDMGYLLLTGGSDHLKIQAPTLNLMDYTKTWSFHVDLEELSAIDNDSSYTTILQSGDNHIALRKGGTNWGIYCYAQGVSIAQANTWVKPEFSKISIICTGTHIVYRVNNVIKSSTVMNSSISLNSPEANVAYVGKAHRNGSAWYGGIDNISILNGTGSDDTRLEIHNGGDLSANATGVFYSLDYVDHILLGEEIYPSVFTMKNSATVTIENPTGNPAHHVSR